MAALEKSGFLYHGSPKRSLDKLEPGISPGTGEKSGRLVYASPNKAIASIFLAEIGGRWSAGVINDIPYALIPMTREEFIAKDKGGVLYVLPDATFAKNQGKGMGESEWVSHEAVEPVERIPYGSSLQAMLDNGVQVYFVTPSELEEINKSKHKKDTLEKLQSENKRTGINVRRFA